MTAPSFRHMAVASLVSAVAWVDASINYSLRGKSYSKAYLFDQRDAVLADPAMVAPPSTPGGWYHTTKNRTVVFLETAQRYGGEEMPSKFLSFVAVTSGLALGFVVGFVAGVVAFMGLG